MLLKETRNIGYGYFLAELLAFAVFMSLCRSNLSAVLPGYMEITISLLATVCGAFSAFNRDERELLTSYPASAFRIAAQRYAGAVVPLFLLAGAQACLVPLIAGEGSLPKLLGFFPVALLLSSLAFLAASLFRDPYGGLVAALLFFPAGYWCGYRLRHRSLPYWYEYFSIFDTTFLSDSPLWLTNRILLVCVSAVLWILYYSLLRGKNRQTLS